MPSTHDDLRAVWTAEYNQPFAGWDFSYLAKRRVMLRTRNAWNYTRSVVAAIGHARSLLDMDTGGGEFLAALPQRPLWTRATEGYGPNVLVARQRLAPLGVEVVEVQGVAHLPFADGQFDVVTNRHGAYEPHEVRRVLAGDPRLLRRPVLRQAGRDPYHHPIRWVRRCPLPPVLRQGAKSVTPAINYPEGTRRA